MSKKVAKSVGRGISGVFTLGTSEIARNNLGKNNLVSKILQTPGMIVTGGQSGGYGGGDPNAPVLTGVNGGQSAPDLLATTGGAPLLANIGMGVDPKEAMAGYFGKNVKDGSWGDFLSTLNPKDLESINSVQDQLLTIQNTRDLRQKAVENVMHDFPNIAVKAAQDRQSAGGEFDQVTKGYMEQALNSTAAKYNMSGGLSSGAANEAFSKTGADMALKKLDYMGQREQTSYAQGADAFNVRLGEVNALRDFQNTMLGVGVSQGFSANQANLQRQFQGQQMNAERQQQQNLADQGSSNAMFGALGSLAGTAIGGYFGGPMGAAAGSQVGGSLANGMSGQTSSSRLNLNSPQSDSNYSSWMRK